MLSWQMTKKTLLILSLIPNNTMNPIYTFESTTLQRTYYESYAITRNVVGWDLMALSAQSGHIMHKNNLV